MGQPEGLIVGSVDRFNTKSLQAVEIKFTLMSGLKTSSIFGSRSLFVRHYKHLINASTKVREIHIKDFSFERLVKKLA